MSTNQTHTESALAEISHAGDSADLEKLHVPHSVLSVIPYPVAIEYFALPYGIDESGRIEMLMAYPYDIDSIQALGVHADALIKPRAVKKDEIMRLIAKHYGKRGEKSPKSDPTETLSSSSQPFRITTGENAITIVDDIVHEAVRLRASDIHLEPYDREMNVRFRIDGVLQEMAVIPSDRVREVSSRIKIMGKMDIAEKRRSQDGRIRVSEGGKDVDIRVSTLPTDFGEKLVLRILDKGAFEYSLDAMGLDPSRLALFKRSISMPNGIVLLTGPTGSGKTTTLYCGINYLRKPGINISTVEDPIEYNIRGVSQTQIHPNIGMTFAHTLRTLLRQDPNVIMVGEMRDQETAEIAIRASLTGHLVLSTLHTNDSPSAVTRLIDMGIEPYLVSSSVTVIVAQRLVRRICEHCKCEEDVPDSVKKEIGLPLEARIYKGLGCTACGHTGYRGRIGIYEVLPISEDIRRLINQKAYASEIAAQGIKEGLVTLKQDALSKLSSGITSLPEVLREISVVS